MLALAVLAAPLGVHAQAYPSKTLRLILPFPPSGGIDTLGRGIAQTLSAQIGQQVVADNRPGAGGNLDLELASKAYGMFVPAGTSRDIIDRLNQELRKTLTNPELVKRLDAVGVETRTGTPEELGRFVKSESVRFGKVIKSASINPI